MVASRMNSVVPTSAVFLKLGYAIRTMTAVMVLMKSIAELADQGLSAQINNLDVIQETNAFQRVSIVTAKMTVLIEVMKLDAVRNTTVYYFQLNRLIIFYHNLAPVTIVKPPPPMMHLQASTIFEVTCTAVGVPTPEIVWRLNWGHIPEKCKTTSINGTGVLTCPDIQVQDSGAYSCEAINIRGSVFAVPDVILVVTDHRPGICPSGSFNEEAKFETECIPCFCFGIVTTCKSADLYTYHLQPPFDAHKVIGVNVRPNGQVDVGDTSSSTVNRTIPTPSRFGVQVYRQRTDTGSSYVPYFEMPENYNSNQLKSYGGYLKYNIQYRGYGAPLSFAPDVIVSVRISLTFVSPRDLILSKYF